MSLLRTAATVEGDKIKSLLNDLDASSRVMASSVVTFARQKETYLAVHLAGVRTKIRSSVQQLCALITAKGDQALREVDERTADLKQELTSRRECVEDLLVRAGDGIRSAKRTTCSESDFDICVTAHETQASLQALLLDLEREVAPPHEGDRYPSEQAFCEQAQAQGQAQAQAQARLVVLLDGMEEVTVAARRLFEVAEEKRLVVSLPDVASPAAALEALRDLLDRLFFEAVEPGWASSPLYATLSHVLDGICALASSSPSIPDAELGEVGACTLMIDIMRMDCVREDAALTGKCLRVVQALCWYNYQDKQQRRFSENASELCELGIYTGA